MVYNFSGESSDSQCSTLDELNEIITMLQRERDRLNIKKTVVEKERDQLNADELNELHASKIELEKEKPSFETSLTGNLSAYSNSVFCKTLNGISTRCFFLKRGTLRSLLVILRLFERILEP